MLVLSRRVGEMIYINDNITIMVVDIDRGRVRLGIDAPRDVPIFRHELWERGARHLEVVEEPKVPKEPLPVSDQAAPP